MFDYIKSGFETKLINLNTLLIRDEYKVWIYKHYFIPSIRFLLTVHTDWIKDWITTLCNKYLKTGLGITSISTLYKTTMTQAYTRIRILGDETVNSALQSKLDRGKNWLCKKFHHRPCRKNVSTSHNREQSGRNA